MPHVHVCSYKYAHACKHTHMCGNMHTHGNTLMHHFCLCLWGIQMSLGPRGDLGSALPAHLSQCELSLELLLPDSCWASSRIFSMSPLWMEREAGTCSWLPAETELPLPLPLLLKCSSTQDPARQKGELSPTNLRGLLRACERRPWGSCRE